jgi:Arc/MetJ-type ribon-helix-helix transcriptional regulator
LPKKTKYPYKLTVNFYDFQGQYLEEIVKDGQFSSINHAIRVAVDRLAASFPTYAVVEMQKDDEYKRKHGLDVSCVQIHNEKEEK